MLGSSASLQNLAWLGKDGKVHTVDQNQNNANGRQLIGSSAPVYGAVSPM
jgi:hypothetical protein